MAHADKMLELYEVLNYRAQKAQDRAIHYYNRNRRDISFKVGDLVWLDARYIERLRPCPGLDFKHIGPFPITELVGARSYRLELPLSLSRLRNVFNVDKLNKYTPLLEGQHARQQLPVVLDNTTNWPVAVSDVQCSVIMLCNHTSRMFSYDYNSSIVRLSVYADATALYIIHSLARCIEIQTSASHAAILDSDLDPDRGLSYLVEWDGDWEPS